ncbi:hypothetical protein DOTSEDRAFT_71795 [Dothistroma septosporum NZE10]|uniref:Uncharacterized protein n=1 Tax=Dothistroma septosporum (strain NZE10 / CBS 128990) TaxID=675120 RepID=N1PMG8_DOTSN|nr:hypothetical protein DOTSEDRAFT_71795 [Dothistroma septosporum NZE10]
MRPLSGHAPSPSRRREQANRTVARISCGSGAARRDRTISNSGHTFKAAGKLHAQNGWRLPAQHVWWSPCSFPYAHGSRVTGHNVCSTDIRACCGYVVLRTCTLAVAQTHKAPKDVMVAQSPYSDNVHVTVSDQQTPTFEYRRQKCTLSLAASVSRPTRSPGRF